MQRRTTTIQKHIEQQGFGTFQDKTLERFVKVRVKLDAFLNSKTYLNPEETADKDCFDFCTCFVKELCNWNFDGDNGFLIDRINQNCYDYQARCFADRKIPSFAKHAKELMDEIAHFERDLDNQKLIKKMESEVASYKNPSYKYGRSCIKYSIVSIIMLLLGIISMYFIHLMFIRTVSDDKMYREFDAIQKQLIDRYTLSAEHGKILLPAERKYNIISEGGMFGRYTDESIMSLGASVFISANQFVEGFQSMLIQTPDDSCYEVRWDTSKLMMDKVSAIMKNEALFKFSNKKIKSLPSEMTAESKVRMVEALEEVSAYDSIGETFDLSLLADDLSSVNSVAVRQNMLQGMQGSYIIPQQYFNNLNRLLDEAWKNGKEEDVQLFAKHWKTLSDAFNHEKNTMFFLAAVDPQEEYIVNACEILKHKTQEDVRHFLEKQVRKDGFEKNWPEAHKVFEEEKYLEDARKLISTVTFMKSMGDLWGRMAPMWE